MSARSQETWVDQSGGEGEEVTEDQLGVPERLFLREREVLVKEGKKGEEG